LAFSLNDDEFVFLLGFSDEILVIPPVIKAVDHPYSNLSYQGIQINAYAFEEVFAEKIRALTERERPRDLYDVV
jgi:predicted nucleotidyltransferase component of viral defense system